MKKMHIILLIMLVVTLGVVISTFGDSSTYANFEALEKHPQQEFHVIGSLNTEKPIEFNPLQPDRFSFYMIDQNGQEKKVVYYDAKPQDFEKSEQVVIVAKANGDEVLASSLLLKCPSKYDEEDTPEAFQEKAYEVK